MPEINIRVFKRAVDILALFGETPRAGTPVAVVETERTLAFRPSLRGCSVGLVIPKAVPSSGGMSYTNGEVAGDISDGTDIGGFWSIESVKRLLRAVRVERRRGESPIGFARLDPDTATLALTGPGQQAFVASVLGWAQPGIINPRLPVYLTTSGAGTRISPSVLNAMGQAGRKISPRATSPAWTHVDGRWEIQDLQGTTLRVATWPTNP